MPSNFVPCPERSRLAERLALSKTSVFSGPTQRGLLSGEGAEECRQMCAASSLSSRMWSGMWPLSTAADSMNLIEFMGQAAAASEAKRG